MCPKKRRPTNFVFFSHAETLRLAEDNGQLKEGDYSRSCEVFHGNPFDGHTLAQSLSQMERLSGRYPHEAYRDKGYRGAKSKEGVNCEVIIPGTRGKRSRTIRRFMKRRSAIEPIIGHMKSDHGMDPTGSRAKTETGSTP